MLMLAFTHPMKVNKLSVTNCITSQRKKVIRAVRNMRVHTVHDMNCTNLYACTYVCRKKISIMLINTCNQLVKTWPIIGPTSIIFKATLALRHTFLCDCFHSILNRQIAHLMPAMGDFLKWYGSFCYKAYILSNHHAPQV